MKKIDGFHWSESAKSDMGPKLQFNRVRIQIRLYFEIGLIVFTYIVIDQGNRNHQGNKTIFVLLETLQEFLFFIRSQLFFKITHNMLKDIEIFLYSPLQR